MLVPTSQLAKPPKKLSKINRTSRIRRNSRKMRSKRNLRPRRKSKSIMMK